MTPAISVVQLQKCFDERTVLGGVDLEVAPGERVALVGPNGSGKTTLMRVILGFVRGDGLVRVNGLDPWADHARAMEHVGYVPQRAPALLAPVGELVAAWSRMRGGDRDELDSVAESFGLDLRNVATVRFTALSGGMQQKLLAAMVLASSAGILLFDEPTANLDPAARADFLDRLTRRHPAPTLLVSSHRLEELRDLVDRVVVLTDGRIQFDDHRDAFLARPDLARAAGILGGAEVLPLRRP